MKLPRINGKELSVKGPKLDVKVCHELSGKV
jgi:hypothetical protein